MAAYWYTVGSLLFLSLKVDREKVQEKNGRAETTTASRATVCEQREGTGQSLVLSLLKTNYCSCFKLYEAYFIL